MYRPIICIIFTIDCLKTAIDHGRLYKTATVRGKEMSLSAVKVKAKLTH